MKINSTKFYTSLFVIVLFLQLYLPSFKLNIFIQIALLLLFFQFEKLLLTRDFLRTVLPVIALFFIGFLGAVFNKYPLVAILKDIFHFIKPLLGLLIGYCFYKKINDFRLFIKTIVLVGFASAIIHFIIVFLFSNSETVSGIREFGKDNFLELFAVFFLGYYKKFQKEQLFEKRLHHRLIFLTLLVSCLLYLSRTMMIVSIIILLSVHGFTYITKATLKVAGILVLLIIGFYMFLYSINIQRDKKGIEAFLYKVKIAPAEIFKTQIDRENHKDLWDHWRGYEAKRAFALMNENPKSYIIGSGYGSLVNLKFRAPLSDDAKGMKFISELHNGYIYILYKTGIFGMIIYLSFLIGIYKKIYIKIDMKTVFISAIGLSYLFTTLTITGIYNASDTIIFLLGALLFFKNSVNSKIIES
jgi:hypothetical protein